jgi:hypothetical protein
MTRAGKVFTQAELERELAALALLRRPISSVLERFELHCHFCQKPGFRLFFRITMRPASTYNYRGTVRVREASVETHVSDPKGWWFDRDGMSGACARCFAKVAKECHFEGKLK